MSKYNNTKKIVDGITFHSKKEAERYLELKLLAKSGKITNLRLQPKYQIIPKRIRQDGTTTRAAHYTADFEYMENGKLVVEDVKGFKTDIYKLKKKLFEFVHNIDILET
jgi:hypothetical protein